MDFKIQLFSAIILSMTAISTTSASSQYTTEKLTPSMLSASTLKKFFDEKSTEYITTCFEENHLDANTICPEKNEMLPLLIIRSSFKSPRCYRVCIDLIKKGINPKILKQQGVSLLHHAAWANYAEIVEILLKKGVSINAVDSRNFTPLHLACKGITFTSGDIVTMALLIRSGANLSIKANNNETPRSLIEHNEVVRMWIAKTLFPLVKRRKFNDPVDSPKKDVFITAVERILQHAQTINFNDCYYWSRLYKEDEVLATFVRKSINFYFGPRKKVVFPNTPPKNNEYPKLTAKEKQLCKELFTKTFYQLAVELYHHGLSKREFAVFTNLGKLIKTNKLRDLKINFEK